MSIFNYAEDFEKETGIKMMKKSAKLSGTEIEIIADKLCIVALLDEEKCEDNFFSNYEEIQIKDLKLCELDKKRNQYVYGHPDLTYYLQIYYLRPIFSYLQHNFREAHLFANKKQPMPFLFRGKGMHERYSGPAIMPVPIALRGKTKLKTVEAERRISMDYNCIISTHYGQFISFDPMIYNDDILYLYNGHLTIINDKSERMTGSLLIGRKYLVFYILDSGSQQFLCSNIYDVEAKFGWITKAVRFKVINSPFPIEFEPSLLRFDFISYFDKNKDQMTEYLKDINKNTNLMVEHLKDALVKLSQEARKAEETKIIVEINTFGDLALGLRKYGYEVTGMYCDHCRAPLPLTKENQTISEVVCKYCGTVNRVKDHEKEYQKYLKAFSEGIEKGIKELMDGGRISIKKVAD